MSRHGIALALGGGGMFGAYQAGLWAGLQPSFTPAHIFGASIGAFNGFAVSSGCDAGELVDLWLDFREAAQARWRFPWPPLSGCIDAAQFHEYLRRHSYRFRPFRPLTVAITRLWPFRPFTVTGSAITWRHLAASCSVPVIMPPCRLPEGLGVDGGLLTSVPAWAALEAGYHRIVAVNILPNANSPVLHALKRVMCTLSRFDPKVDAARPSPKVIWVEPSRPLGPLFLSAVWDPKRARDWVDLGRDDARDLLRRMKQWD